MDTSAEPLVIGPEFRVQLRRPNLNVRPRPLGQILVDIGALDPGDLLKAVAMQSREDVPIGQILLANGMIDERHLLDALALQLDCGIADFSQDPPDARLIAEAGAEFCLQHGIVPWKRAGGAVVVAATDPARFAAALARLPESFGTPLMALATEHQVETALVGAARSALVQRAESRVAIEDSCRNWSARRASTLLLVALALLVAALVQAPQTTLLVLCGWALAALVVNTGLKLAAFLMVQPFFLKRRPVFSTRRPAAAMRLPVVSLLVPLYHEKQVVGRLLRGLARLSYPRELLDICLIVETDDTATRSALAGHKPASYIRLIEVPEGTLRTKPRALNFALDFARGSVVGVYDAEDVPDPDQIFRVVRRFHEAGPQVACLQGVLDFYNAGSNWLSRCFAIEFATWFRVVLPGLARMGLVIPLGGTTVFFRRDVLEECGGWDAHNVTEDADLGVRLARRGYRTELLPTVTMEEANCRFWPWIRQRSRWLKGYAVTWVVHMRHPFRLLRELGLWRFLGVQMLFLGALSQFLLAPVLWSFWAIPFGLPHPIRSVVGPDELRLLVILFLAAEAVSLLIGAYATAGRRHRWLWPWLPTLHFYFPLATIATIKALAELAARPFYWDKTAHGLAPRHHHRQRIEAEPVRPALRQA